MSRRPSISTRIALTILLGASLAVAPAHAQAPDTAGDAALLARVRDEGMHHSRVAETATILSDVFGPRLAGSRAWGEAAEWARGTLAGYGLTARLEPWGTRRGNRWTLESQSLELTAPYYARLVAYPFAWSPATGAARPGAPGDGAVVRGTPVLVTERLDSAADVARADSGRLAARVRGRIVMLGEVPALSIRDEHAEPLNHRWTDAQLDSLARLTDPGSPRDYWEDAGDYPAMVARRQGVYVALARAGALAVLTPSRNPLVPMVGAYQAYDTDLREAPPAMVVSRDDYGRLANLVRLTARAGRPAPEVALQIRARLDAPRTRADSTGYDVTAELPGSDPALKAEVVMVGGHFDSWTSGTGATDNAAGAAVAIEAVRLLTAAGAHPRRTIRVALWDGEEHEDYFGSLGWVRAHLGDPETMRLKPEQARLSTYLNFDNGTGRIRGVWLQGNAAARPVFQRLLAPVADLGPTTLTIANTGSTDHMPFTSVGIPAFTFLQDPLDYETRTHHTNADVAANLAPDDLRQAAVVTATVLYGAANLPERLPRMPLPPPHRATGAGR
ncbi:MAG TPA: M28 family peptidase [Gemmatirosa sp.]